ncbi:hypothetical protein ASC97_15480 [Rhizobium sp. Root1203]|uniref:hypothetical protein n=1 Tax=Rhizobium sp. Root1203 TaxID=1736427 RepID=UPI00070F61F3|nr:hypothetical protein [Rhizobium sp. Root1203]KQV11322.1 hypothetical protein ASC97_15480 [Rhizobium sp. Root1203]
MDQFHDDDDRILSDAELDRLTNTSKTTRWRMRKKGDWPPFIEFSPQLKGNTLGQIRRLIAAKLGEAEARQHATESQQPRGRGRPRKPSGQF